MSWGPIRKKTDEWICKRLASAMPILVTRGAESNEMLTSWGCGEKIVSLPDVVIAAAELLPELKAWRTTLRQAGSLGIAPIDWGFARKVNSKEMEIYINKLVTLSKEWCQNEGRSITVFPQVEVNGMDDDRIVARRLLAALQEAGLPSKIADDLDWSAYWQEIAAQEVFVGCRMHSCIFAMVCGVPTVGLGYQPKFRELFTQLGWEDRSHLIDQFSPAVVAEQLRNLATDCDRQEIIRHIDHVGHELIKAMDDAWHRTIAACSQLSKPSTTHAEACIRISVVTPSFNQVDFLKRCAASVQDQEGDFQLEHLIHDGGSGREFDQWASNQNDAIYVSERDEGMYDAINRGFRKAKGDVIAWLNCDEQYLPGALQVVADFFRNNPKIDILFGDVILVSENMTPLAYRRAVVPSTGHIRYSHLSTFSAATFVRRKVLDDGHYLDIQWKTIADAVLIDELLSSGYRAANLNKPLAVFSMLGSNLGQSMLLYEERSKWEKQLGNNHQFYRFIYIWRYRIHRLLVGAYWPRHVTVAAHSHRNSGRIITKKWISGQWSSAVSEAGNLRNKADGEFSGMVIKRRKWPIGILHAICIIILAISEDKHTDGDAVKGPFILLFSLLFLSFKSRTKDLIPIALVYFFVAAYLLSERPTDVMIIRLGTFSLGAILAIFWTTSIRSLESWVQSTVGLIRKLPGPVILSNSKGIVVLANRTACLMLGMQEDRILHRKIIIANPNPGTQQHSVEEWGERVPTETMSFALDDNPETILFQATALYVGRGRYKFYAFTLVPND